MRLLSFCFFYEEGDTLPFSNSTAVDYTYTSTGKLATVTDARGVTTYAYDADDRLLARTDPDNQRIQYTYDSVGNRTSVTIPAGTTTYTFDALNRLATVTDPSQGVTRYTYDAVGNLVKTDLSNSTEETRTYDRLNHLISLENRNSTRLISSYHYTLDAAGMRTAVAEDGSRYVQYTYDNLHRLVQEVITDPSAGNRTTIYAYDAVGNRLSRNDSTDGVTTYTYDHNDRLLNETLNGLTTTYTYDNNGNTLSRFKNNDDQTTYTWDDQNRMVGADVTDAMTTHHTRYRYNAEGIRVASIVDGQETRYLIDANRPDAEVLEEYTADGTIQTAYVYGRDLISQSRSGEQSFYERDGLGSTRALTDTTGMATETYNYDAFGNQISSTGNIANNYRYAGEQYDPNVGEYYQRARYYDSRSGRFTRMDSFEGNLSTPLSLHKYLYANGNPVNWTDPSGMFSVTEETSVLLGIEIEATQGAIGASTTTTLGADLAATLPEAVAEAAPMLVNVGRAPISIAGRIAIAVARSTVDLIGPIAEDLMTENLGIPMIFWGSELPETRQHTFDAITGNSSGFKDDYGKASPFLGRINPKWSKNYPSWLDTALSLIPGSELVRDEYPYNTTIPGGPIFYYLHQVSVRYIDKFEQTNTSPTTRIRPQGTKLNTFYGKANGADIKANDPKKMWFAVGVTPTTSFFIRRDGTPYAFPSDGT